MAFRARGWCETVTRCGASLSESCTDPRSAYFRLSLKSSRVEPMQACCLPALCCPSGPDTTWETPIRARSRSNGSRSLRLWPLSIARFTNESIAPHRSLDLLA
jgi:hypothetical protein